MRLGGRFRWVHAGRGRKHSFSFVIEVAKGVDPKVQRIRRRVVLIFALRDVPEPLSLRRRSHCIFNLRGIS